MIDELEALREEVARLRAQVVELESELDACRRESRQRWEAIGKLAPAAKRLRTERDQLRAQLAVLSGDSDSD